MRIKRDLLYWQQSSGLRFGSSGVLLVIRRARAAMIVSLVDLAQCKDLAA